MKRVIVTSLVLSLALSAGWTRTYGGSGIDFGRHILKCSDGNHAILGGTSSFGAGKGDIWLLKIDLDGDTLWARTYGGDSAEYPEWIEETPDSGFIILGTTASYGAGKDDIWLVKTDKKGKTLWTKTYGGAENEDETRRGLVGRMFDGGYLVVGETKSFGAGDNDLWILITDSLGDTISTRTWGDTNYNRLCCANRVWWWDEYTIVEISEIDPFFTFISLDSNGVELWNNKYHETYIDCLPWEITYINKGYFTNVVAGSAYTNDPFAGPDPWTAKLICAPFGVNEEWARTYLEYGVGIAYSIEPTSDTCYILTGKPWAIFKIDSNGLLLWSKEYDGNGKHVIETSDGGYLVTGEQSGDLWLLKTDINGDTLGITEPPSSETPAPSSEMPVTHLLEISSPINSEIVLRYSLSQGEPGSLKFFDASGRMVESISVRWQGEVKVSRLSPGVYFARLEAGGRGVTRKVVVVR